MNHTGWIVTDDLRGLPADQSQVGAVSSWMTPQAFQRLADAAAARELEPLIHRIARGGANGTERFLSDPRLRSGRLGNTLTPLWQGIRELLRSIQWTARKARNVFRPRPVSRRVPLTNPISAPNAAKPAPRQGTGGRRLPEAPVHPAAAKTSPNPPVALPDNAATMGAPAEPPAPPQQAMSQTQQTSPEAPEPDPSWERAHQWSIVDRNGQELYRGQAVGVEGTSGGALRARRAPLDQIPGIPRNAEIQWQGHPEWSVSGVSATGAARSAVYVASAALAGGGVSWDNLRRMGADMAEVTRGTPDETKSDFDLAVERLLGRYGDLPAQEAVEAALERVSHNTADSPTPDVDPELLQAAQSFNAEQEPPQHNEKVAAAASGGVPVHERYAGQIAQEEPPAVGMAM